MKRERWCYPYKQNYCVTTADVAIPAIITILRYSAYEGVSSRPLPILDLVKRFSSINFLWNVLME